MFPVRWCVMATRLLINTAYGVDWVGSVNGTTSKMSSGVKETVKNNYVLDISKLG